VPRVTTTATKTATTARAQNRVATARRVRRKPPNRQARIPARVRRRLDAIATTVARAHPRRRMHKDTMTTTVNRRVTLKKISSRVPMPIWARKAASTLSVTSPAAAQRVNPTRP